MKKRENKNYNILDHIRIEGGRITTNSEDPNVGYDIVTELFARLFDFSFSYSDNQYRKEFLPISEHLEKIDYIVGVKPIANAYCNSYKNEVKIELFTISTFCQLSSIMDIVEKMQYYGQNNNEIPITTLKDIWDDKQVHIKGAEELKSLFNRWADVSNRWDLFDLFSPEIIQDTTITALRILFCHEMSHWHFSKFTDQTQELMLGITKNGIINTISSLKEDGNKKQIENFLNDDILKNWAEEVTADLMALISLKNTVDPNDFFIPTALYFSLLGALEVFEHGYTGLILSTTHPPAYLRDIIVFNLFAESLGIPSVEFTCTLGGPWFLFDYFFRCCLHQLRKEALGIE